MVEIYNIVNGHPLPIMKILLRFGNTRDTYFMPRSLSIPPENIRKPEV